MTTPAALERYLHEHIPISGPLGVRVLEAGAAGVRLAAPLAPNLNHRRTAFGGSLAALAILSAWSWLHLKLRGEGFVGRLVIQGNSMEYLAAAEGDFEAGCRAPGAERWALFARTLAQRGRARIELDAEVRVGEALVASFRGQYVALRS
ncbi:MAG TPA: YiiD C-terminal domain-containing protein [Gemmatimonadales bacterium]|nr:YiiD C-terminal domain-containing protein [Gemmatimonadales bacterium]